MGTDDPALGKMLDASLNVSINSDDPAAIPTDPTNEYSGAARALGLGRADIIRCVLAAVDACWMDDSQRRDLRRSIEVEIDKIAGLES